jgi:hypothetical protein
VAKGVPMIVFEGEWRGTLGIGNVMTDILSALDERG